MPKTYTVRNLATGETWVAQQVKPIKVYAKPIYLSCDDSVKKNTNSMTTRSRNARIYSANVRKRYKLKGIIYSILLALIFGIFFGFCHIKSIASADGAEIITPRLVEMTYYLPTGSNCANTLPPHEGIVAFAPEYIGDTAIIYESENGKIGDLIGIYEIYDTGFGKHLDGIGSSIKAGKTIDVYFEHDIDGKRFIKEHGDEVFIQVVKAQG